MSGKNWRLVAYEPFEFEKQPVEVQDFRKSTDHCRGIYGTYLKSMKAAKLEDVNMLLAGFRVTRMIGS